MNSLFNPNISCTTKTCPSQPAPAPIPIVGILTEAVTLAAKSAGIFSITNEKHPNSSNNLASLINFSASASSFARTLYEPN